MQPALISRRWLVDVCKSAAWPRAAASTLRLSCRYSSSTSPASQPPVANIRWLSDIKNRLGQCIKFGLRTDSDVEAARRICQVLGSSWKGLLVGAEGFSMEPPQKGLPDPIWQQPLVWGDQDSMAHVNNARYLRFAETSRVWYFRRLQGLVAPEHRTSWANLPRNVGIGLILKTIKVDFLLPLEYPDTISLVHSLTSFGGGDPPTEINLRCWVLSHNLQRVAARIEENVPLYDYQAGKKSSVPPWLSDVLVRARQHEHESREYWTSVRSNIESWLKGLEDSTVNSGREEDIGGGQVLGHAGSAEPKVEDVADDATEVNKQASKSVEMSHSGEPTVEVKAKEGAKSRLQQNASWAKDRKPTWGVRM